MNILICVTYYSPHVSGLTVCARRLAEALAGRGHAVTVATSRFNHRLAASEIINGVRVVRLPVRFRISKGVLMKRYCRTVLPLLRQADIVMVNMPATPVEAVVVPLLARLAARKPSLAVFHCDVKLPPGLKNRIITAAVRTYLKLGVAAATKVVAYSEDYALHAGLLRRHRPKLGIIPPPVDMALPDDAEGRRFRELYAPDSERLIGFAGRLAAEKGVEYLLRALPLVRKEIPGAKVLLAGEHHDVVGEDDYRRRISSLLSENAGHCHVLGYLEAGRMPYFFRACDVTVLPSLNSTESFGLVQVESMLCGTPVVASDLPGMRLPVAATGMGRLAPPGDAAKLAEAIVAVIRDRSLYVKDRAEVAGIFSMDGPLAAYEALLRQIVAQDSGRA